MSKKHNKCINIQLSQTAQLAFVERQAELIYSYKVLHLYCDPCWKWG
jgi:hypothetical protein